MKNYKDFLKTKAIRTINSSTMKVSKDDLNDNLFDYQRDIVHWSLEKGKSAIFADCGMGKTIMQLSWANQVTHYTKKPVLLLAPLAVSTQTERESIKFGINAKVIDSPVDYEPMIYITNYQKLHKFDLSVFGGVVLDESSILKSFQGKFRNDIIDGFRDCPFKLACTATPSPNDYTELGNHADFLDVCGMSEMLSMFFINDVAGAKNGTGTGGWRLKKHAEDKFWEFVGSWAIMIKNPSDLGYSDKGFKLPDLNIKDIIVEVENNSQTLFVEPASTLSERRDARKDSMLERVEVAKRIVKSKPDDQFIIWCDFNDEGDILEKELKDMGAVQVSGSTKDEKKADYMLGFTDGKYRILITKPKIGGFGMNWQNCSNMIFCGLSDSYESFYQSTRRCWRYGQKNDVNVSIIISEKEVLILENVKNKERLFNTMSDVMIKNALKSFNFSSNFKMTYKENCERSDSFHAYLGDSCEVLTTIPDESVGYSVFSPPFASLYTYSNSERDLGNCRDNSEFYEHFVFIAKQLFRIIESGRNVSFHCMNLPTSKFRDGFTGISDFRGDLIRIFQDAGFIYHSEVVIWKDPVVAMQRTKALGLLHKQIKKDSVMSRQGIPDYVVTMRKPGENNKPITHTNEDFPVDYWQKIASPVWMDINQSDTLQKTSAREEKDEKHICPLQLEVIRRLIYLWSNKGDTVLSPFMGIGSEGYEAINLKRKFIGIELKESYYKQALANLLKAEKSGEQVKMF